MTASSTLTAGTAVPIASVPDTARALATTVLPVAARGAILRRPRVLALAQRVDADRRAVREMQRLRARYGPGPVQLRLPLRRFTFVLEPAQVHRVLNQSPVPFAVDTREKKAALSHFQPKGVLASPPSERALRRPFNESVLDTGNPIHRLALPMTAVVREEAEALLRVVEDEGVLTWEQFAPVWWRAVRRVVLGDAARDDEEVTDLLQRLRRDANFAYARPKRARARTRFLESLRGYVDRAEPGSLASLVADTPAAPGTEKHQQVPQWLFAFDATAWATFRTLALLSTHRDAADRARRELPSSPDLPFLRACVLESLRLWPTTPAILRDTTEQTQWDTGVLPAGAALVVFAPYFHRDEERFPEAHRFAPELWLREGTDEDWPLVPFSGGPGMCPGRNVVLLTASVLLSCLVEQHDYRVAGAPLAHDRPLPGTVSPFLLRFTPEPAGR